MMQKDIQHIAGANVDQSKEGEEGQRGGRGDSTKLQPCHTVTITEVAALPNTFQLTINPCYLLGTHHQQRREKQ